MAVDPVTAGIGLVDTLIKRFVKDPDQAQALAAAARSEEFQGDIRLMLGQMEINKEEAKHHSLFVSGWRPGVGWVCTIALAYTFVVRPFLMDLAEFITAMWFPTVELSFTTLETVELFTLLTGMLGFGGLRTYEKLKEINRNNL